jgi:excinuclease UvrABC nuclease subunit
MNLVNNVIGFLNGDDALVVGRIEKELNAAVIQKSYEKAAVLKDRIGFCRRFCARQRFIRKFRRDKLTVVENKNKNIAHIFVKGRLGSGCRQYQESREDPRSIVDRANIIYNWINKNREACEYFFEVLE